MKTYHAKHIPIYLEWFRAKKEDKLKMALRRGHEHASLIDPTAHEKIAERILESGWALDRRNFPRSSLCGLTVISPDKEVAFQIEAMPYDQAVILAAILIKEYEKGEIHLPDVPVVI